MVHLQESGLFNGNTYLVRRNVDLGRNVKDFTLCAWLSLNFLRGESNHWFDLADEDNFHLLTGSKLLNVQRYFFIDLSMYLLTIYLNIFLFFIVFDNGVNGPRIHLKKYHPRIDDEININFEKFDFQTWHHYCFLFTSQAQFPYPGGYVNLTNKAYVDGELVNTGKSI